MSCDHVYFYQVALRIISVNKCVHMSNAVQSESVTVLQLAVSSLLLTSKLTDSHRPFYRSSLTTSQHNNAYSHHVYVCLLLQQKVRLLCFSVYVIYNLLRWPLDLNAGGTPWHFPSDGFVESREKPEVFLKALSGNMVIQWNVCSAAFQMWFTTSICFTTFSLKQQTALDMTYPAG